MHPDLFLSKGRSCFLGAFVQAEIASHSDRNPPPPFQLLQQVGRNPVELVRLGYPGLSGQCTDRGKSLLMTGGIIFKISMSTSREQS